MSFPRSIKNSAHRFTTTRLSITECKLMKRLYCKSMKNTYWTRQSPCNEMRQKLLSKFMRIRWYCMSRKSLRAFARRDFYRSKLIKTSSNKQLRGACYDTDRTRRMKKFGCWKKRLKSWKELTTIWKSRSSRTLSYQKTLGIRLWKLKTR